MKHSLTIVFMIIIILNLTGCSKKQSNNEYNDLTASTACTGITVTVMPILSLTPAPKVTSTPLKSTTPGESSKETKKTAFPNKKDDSLTDNEEKKTNIEINNKQNKNQNDSGDTNINNVKATINVFNGWYIDDSWRRYIGEESDTPQIYYGIMVSNVSDTSFDFAIYELIYNDDDKKKEILTGTASFIEDGTKAAFNEDETSLSFTFPFVASDSAAITMQISGLDILEGIDLSNWSIPGHEAG